MNEIITKKTLEQSLNFFSDLNINEEDYFNVLEKFNTFFEKDDNKELLDKITKATNYDKNSDLKVIMKDIINSKEIPHLNVLLQRMIKHEHLLDEIQDYFIEKII